MKIILYTTSEDARKVTKKMQYVATTECYIKEDTSVLNPVLYLNTKGFNVGVVNYAYVEEWGRYYFVNDKVMSNSGTARFSMRVDVLSSFADRLLNLNCLIDRQEFVFSPYIRDEELLTKCDRTVTVKKLGNIGSPSGSYIALTVTGGNS